VSNVPEWTWLAGSVLGDCVLWRAADFSVPRAVKYPSTVGLGGVRARLGKVRLP
jgi:hypothetical protein